MSLRTELGAGLLGLGIAGAALAGADYFVLESKLAVESLRAADPKFNRPSDQAVKDAEKARDSYNNKINTEGTKNGNINNVGSIPRTDANPAFDVLRTRNEADAKVKALVAPHYQPDLIVAIVGGTSILAGSAMTFIRRR